MNGDRTQRLKTRDGAVLTLSQCLFKRYSKAKRKANKAGLYLEVFSDGKAALKDRKTFEYVFGTNEKRKSIKAILHHFKKSIYEQKKEREKNRKEYVIEEVC